MATIYFRHYTSILIFSAIIIIQFTACNNTNDRIEYYDNEHNFPIISSATDSIISLPTILEIEEWGIDDSYLFCRSNNTDIFYQFNNQKFNVIDSFGTIGQGPNEYINPKLVKSNQNNIIITDLAKNTLKNLNTNREYHWNGFCINSPIDISHNIIGYTSLQKSNRIFYTYDLISQKNVDSLNISHGENTSKNIPLNFKVASNGEFTVIVKEFSDDIYIIKLDKNGSFQRIKCLSSQSELSKIKPYYIGVECGEDYFYVLSMKNNIFDNSGDCFGKSTIDIYDYSGKAIEQIMLEFTPRKILLDQNNNRLLALSIVDEHIHIINLNKH